MNIKERTGLLGISDADKDISRNIKILISLVGRLPFVSMPQSYGTGDVTADTNDITAIEYNKAFASAITPDVIAIKCRNIPVDPDDDTRFELVSVIGNLINNEENWLLYDSKYKDLLLIPSLSLLGTSDITNTNLNSSSIRIEGYQVGGSVNGPSSEFITDVKNLGLDNPGKFISKTHAMNLNGLGKDFYSGETNHGTMFGTKYVEMTSNKVVYMASIGSTTKFGGPVSASSIYRANLSAYALLPGRALEYEDLLIPIPL